MKIAIYDEITEETLGAVRSAVNSSSDSSVFVDLDSPGGSLSAAWKIYDQLREFGGEVTVNVSGDCMSAASLILLAAKPEKRTASAHARFLIHKPLIGFYMGPLGSKDVKDIDNHIEAEADKLCRTYLDRTQASESVLRLMMNSEQMFGSALAQNLGFVSTINNYTNRSKKMEAKELLAKIKRLVLADLEVETADGQTLKINGDELVVGAETSAEDGVYLLPDGRKVLVEAGVVKEIQDPAADPAQDPQAEDPEKKEPAPAADPEPAPAEPTEEEKKKDEEIKNLRQQVEDLKAQLANNAKELDEVAGMLDKLKAVKTKAPQVKNQAPAAPADPYSYEALKKLAERK